VRGVLDRVNSNQKVLLQASRGVAACLVLLFHASAMSNKYFHYNLFGISNIGRSGGVDYFFVLTGFLLFMIYGKNIGMKYKVFPYLSNRLIRIYPFYWLITLVVLPVYFLVPSFGFGYETHKDTIVNSLLLLPQKHAPILPIAWSLSHYIFFYLIFSVIMVLRKKNANLLMIIWITLTLCNVLNVPLVGPDIQHHYYLSFLFNKINLEFVAGCLMAKWVLYHRAKYYKTAIWGGISGFVLIWLNNKFSIVPYHDYLLYVIPAVSIMLGLTSVPEKIHLSKWVSGLSKLGDASYSILLTHLLFISILMKITKSMHFSSKFSFLLMDLLIIILTVPACYLVYRLVEKPLVTHIKHMKIFQSKTRQPKTL
jgi:peptidoglycan/LPS O-acetylase OafA/YrhL